ncbi:glycosyltransferase family 1 protein [candidate division KSB1 bacterium]|nr:glycosyltransferase family 1 protein [candidate division KSB1 bacterium]
MKVAYFTESLPPNTDGVVRTLVRLAETLEQENVDYQFYSPVKPNDESSLSRRVRKVSSVPFFLYSDYKMGIPYFNGLETNLDRFRPDLIHIVSETLLGHYGLVYAKKRKIPVVSSYHTHFVSYFSYYGFSKVEHLGWQFLQWFHNQCDRTYAPSPSAVQELIDRGIHGVELWQRGVDLAHFSPAKRQLDLRRSIGAEKKPIVLFVGRLVKEKDLDDVVTVNRILMEKGCDFQMVIVGDGPMRGELEEELPNAHYTGYQHGEKLAQWYASSDLFLFPSTTETFGNVILEAFASGLPVVTVDKGGVADIVTDGRDGFVARHNQPHKIADKVQLLLQNPQQRKAMAVEARKSARRYSWSAINKGLLNSYENVLLNTN